ncbi:internalin A-like protein/ S-layer protein [Strigomonas culicis]|uniref:Internalin A-like protein/ S-layer protein n=1 Tax=Strigomonas culicis TaxID=28005 RepID=S9TT87_9TRYP|nr:internalin A-like protein/ S-layer protein [Strigomonas culicis]EPY28839.1 internalin A-like protein/ S-layer protein [Strigomonas culicis]|eukprot:EPY19733.1 internalin A-like protein/ S-layer protein [Strigomonas culicis]
MVDAINSAAIFKVLQYFSKPPLSLVCASPRFRSSAESAKNGVEVNCNRYRCLYDEASYTHHLNCTVENVEGVLYARWWLRLRTVTELMPSAEGEPPLRDIKQCDLYLRFVGNDRGQGSSESTAEAGLPAAITSPKAYETCLGEVMSLGLVRQLEFIHCRLRATPPGYMPFLALPQDMHTFRSRHTPMGTAEFLTLLNANASTLTSLDLSYFRIPSLQFIGKLCPLLRELELRGAAIERGTLMIDDDQVTEHSEEEIERYRPFSDLAPLHYLRRLDVSYLANKVSFSGMHWCASIRSLNLASCDIVNEDLTDLSDLVNLEELFLSYTKVTSLRFLTNYATLHMLQLAGSAITSEGLQGIDNFTSLRNLDLTNTAVVDVDSVGLCWSLAALNLSKTKVTNEGIRALCHLVYLEHLSLIDTVISSIAPLVAGAHALKRLYLKSTSVNDAGIAGIDQLGDLEDLSLAHTQVTDVAALAKLARLRKLDLFGTPVTDTGIQLLGEAPALEQLIISRTKVSSVQCLCSSLSLQELCIKSSWIRKVGAIDGIARIPNLTSLTITNCKLNSVSCLEGCVNLKLLNLWSTKVTTAGIDALRTCVGLQEVDLGETSVDSITPLCSCTKMQTLILYRTPITSVAGISAMTDLIRLDLAKTRITSVNELVGCSQLEELNVSNTPLMDDGFTEVTHLVSLRQLLMAYTSIRCIGHVGACPNVEEILASNSLITSEGLTGLERASELKKLNLSYSLIQSNISRLACCKKLQKLNVRLTNVPLEEVLYVKQCLPNCRLSHDAVERMRKQVVLTEDAN